MLQNPLIFGIGGVLAAAYFLAPSLLSAHLKPFRPLLLAALYGAVFVASYWLTGLRSAFVVVELGLVFTVLGKLFAINFEMVHTPNYPKNHRCY